MQLIWKNLKPVSDDCGALEDYSSPGSSGRNSA